MEKEKPTCQECGEPIPDGMTLCRDCSRCARIAELEAEVARLMEERDALAEWSCSTCGCRFPRLSRRLGPDQVPEHDGVTRCSKCVEVDALTEQVARLRARLDVLDRYDWDEARIPDGFGCGERKYGSGSILITMVEKTEEADLRLLLLGKEDA